MTARDPLQLRALYTETDCGRASGLPPLNEKRERGWSPFKKDYARLLHAPAFRRLQGKTQLLPGVEDDFFRNRLTHSLEVAQIASGIAGRVNLSLCEQGIHQVDQDLVEFAALAHDLGHPPFGHNGETALDELMMDAGGFEGNAQTLHILAAAERKLIKIGNELTSDFGLDLMYRTLASVLKYDRVIPPTRTEQGVCKGFYGEETDLVAKIKAAVAPGHAGEFKTLECSIMDVADDIAYSTYDLEDTLHAQFVSPAVLLWSLFTDPGVRAEVFAKTNKELVKAEHAPLANEQELLASAFEYLPIGGAPTSEEMDQLAQAQGFKISADMMEPLKAVAACTGNSRLIDSVEHRQMFTAERVGRLINGIELVVNDRHLALSRVRLAREVMIDVELFKHLNFELVIRSPRLAVAEWRGKGIVQRIFTTLLETEGQLLQSVWRQRYERAATLQGKKRVVCDYVAGMTDRYAVETYEALFGAGKTIFKPY